MGNKTIDVDKLYLTHENARLRSLVTTQRSEIDALRTELERYRRVLGQLSQWDALTVPEQWPLADGPYWKRLIETTLHPELSNATPDA